MTRFVPPPPPAPADAATAADRPAAAPQNARPDATPTPAAPDDPDAEGMLDLDDHDQINNQHLEVR